MTHETERAQYAEDVARLGPEAWQYWQYMSCVPCVWVGCPAEPKWYYPNVYRRNPDTYPDDRPVDADKTMQETPND